MRWAVCRRGPGRTGRPAAAARYPVVVWAARDLPGSHPDLDHRHPGRPDPRAQRQGPLLRGAAGRPRQHGRRQPGLRLADRRPAADQLRLRRPRPRPGALVHRGPAARRRRRLPGLDQRHRHPAAAATGASPRSPWCVRAIRCRPGSTVAIPVGTPGLDHAGSVYRMDGVVSLPLRALRDAGLPGVAAGARRASARCWSRMTTTRLAGGRVYDPLNGVDGKVRDLWVRDGRIVAAPEGGRADEVIDLAGKVVMPGGIDLHSHIGGGKVNIARMMLPEEHRAHRQHRHGALPQRQRPRQPVHLHHRLRLRPHGLHHGVRAGDAAGQRPPGPPGDGRHPPPGQRRLRAAGQRRPVPAPGQGRRRPGRHPATTSPGRCTPRKRWRSRSSTPAGSAPSSSTAAGSTSTRRARSTRSPRAPS